MLNNIVTGQSSVFGVSYLDISTSVVISETIKLGTTSVTFNKGEYDLISYDRSSNTNKRISLELAHPFVRSLNNKTFGSRGWKSGKSLFDGASVVYNYTDTESGFFYKSWTNEGGNAPQNALFVAGFAGITHSYGSSTRANRGIVIRDQSSTTFDGKQGYFIGMETGTTNRFLIGKFVGSSVLQVLNSVGYGTSNYNELRIFAWVNNSTIYGSFYGVSNTMSEQSSPTDIAYGGLSVINELYANDSDYSTGDVSLIYFGTSTGTVVNAFPSLSYCELEKPNSAEDVLKKAGGFGDYLNKMYFESHELFAVKYDNVKSIGTWNYGTTEIYRVYANLSITSGSSYNWLFNTYNSNERYYRFDTEMRGTSGTIGGLMIGVTNDFWAFFVNIGTTGIANSIFKTGTSYFTYKIGNPFIYVTPNSWNRLTIIREPFSIKFYVNNQLCDYLEEELTLNSYEPGLSLSTIDTVGYFNKQSGASGGLLNFRNSTVQKLSNNTDDIEIPSGSMSGEIISRYLPTNYFKYVCGNSNVLITYAGASREVMGLSNTYISLTSSNGPEYRLSYSMIRGNNAFDVTSIVNSDTIKYKARGSGIVYNYDANISSANDLDAINDNAIANEILTYTPVSVNISPSPYLEKNDKVYISDSNSGITLSGVIDSHRTNLDMSSGNYTETIIINSNPGNLL